MKVSVITPMYNCEKFISETIESVLNQTYTNWEMIIIDDCSTDKSKQIVKQYIERDKRIRLIALNENSGAADIVLREGDVISIPKNNNTVTINGAVMVPNTVSYIEGENIDYYLNQAGGYSENAKKSKKFIVYMNGQVTKVKGSGKKQIEPGCEIIVPSKAKKRTNMGNILGYATTFSTLGMMVASIANLIKK